MNFQSKHMRTALIILVVALVASVAWVISVRDREGNEIAKNQANHQRKKTLYQCPMHPDVVQDHPGQCPICHMALQPVESHEAHAHLSESNASTPGAKNPDQEATAKGKVLFYRHPMQPNITSKTPAKDEMGMDYIPVYESDLKEGEVSNGTSGVEGRAGFSLSGDRQQLIGVTWTEVKKQSLRSEIRATGRVAYDPELFTAIEEYRQALIARGQMSEGAFAELANQSDALAASSKTKLKLMGLTDEQIRKVARSQDSAMNLLLPKGRVWVYAEIFEYEISGVKPGQKVEAEAPSMTGEVFRGTISSISPILNAPTRTVRVRAEVPDPKGLLRPDTFLNVKIIRDLGQKLAVPEDSVLHSGDQSYVFIQKDGGRFEPKAVTLGMKAGDFYEVLDGLSEGQKVVTGANFLIDSESRLRSVLNQKAGSK